MMKHSSVSAITIREGEKDPTKTVILVTHDMGAVKKYCNKAVLIKDGEVIVNGNKDDVANRYTLENMRADKRDTDNDKADEYPTGLNARVPMLRINALSKQILTCMIRSSLKWNTSMTNQIRIILQLLCTT